MSKIRTFAVCAILALSVSGRAAADGATDVRASDLVQYSPGGEVLRLTGVVTGVYDDDIDPNWVWMSVRDDSGTAPVAIMKSVLPIAEARKLLDAEVSFSGLIGEPQAYRRTMSTYLCAADTSPVVLKPAPADFFSIPYSGRKPSPHRQRIKGTVRASTSTAFYLSTGTKVIPATGESQPKAGDAVVVAGFISPNDPGSIMTEALVRSDPNQQPTIGNQQPTTDVERLFHDDNGKERIDVRKNQKPVRLSGIVNTRSPGAGRAGIRLARTRVRPAPATLCDWDNATFELMCGRRTLFVDASAFPEGAADVQPGCRVEVSGIAVFEFERDTASLFPVFRRVSIIPYSPHDIRILARPPWWTPRRLGVVIAILGFILAGLGVLTRILWRLASRRAREAYHDRLARAHAESRTEERTRLATDLHDSLAQNLTGVTLQVDAARKARTRRPEAVEGHLDTAERMLRSCRTELRRCLWDLRYEALDNPDFAAALRQTVEPVRGDAGVSFDVRIRRSILNDTTAHAALSIVRELVSNAVQHGKARHVRISGDADDGCARLTVADDGCGFDPAAAPGMAEGHFGLVGIRDRVRALGGNITFASSAGNGCTATFTLALQETRHVNP